MEYVKDIILTLKTCLQGMGVTLKHFLFEENITEFYPEVKPRIHPRFRGALVLETDKCGGCNLCVRACPVNCITIVTEGKGKDRWVSRYDIDLSKCMWCELCVEACPDSKRSLSMSNEYELAVYRQEDMILHFGRGPKPPEPPPAPAAGGTCGLVTSEAPTREGGA